MAKITITMEDMPPVVDEEGEEQEPEGLGVDVEVIFDPEAPAVDGRPDMEKCTTAQGLAFIMLTVAREQAQQVTTTRMEGQNEDGKATIWTPGDSKPE